MRNILSSGLLLCLALSCIGCASSQPALPTPTPLPPVVQQERLIIPVRRGPIISWRDVLGEVVPEQQDTLFFRASGVVTRVTVRKGDLVKEGEVLAEMQIDDLLDQLEQARIDLDLSLAAYETESLQRAYEFQKAESDVAIAQAQMELARSRYESAYGARKEEAKLDLTMAEQRLKTAQAWLDLVRGRPASEKEQLVRRNQLSVERLERLIAERQILAPYDCMILEGYLFPGNHAEAFAPIFMVGDPKKLVVRIAFDQELYTILDPATEASLSLTSSMDTLYPVYYLPEFLPVSNPKQGLKTMGDEIALDYLYFSIPEILPSGQLVAGMGVTLRIVLGKKDDALLLPPEAIRGSERFHYVIVLDTGAEGEIHRRIEILRIGLRSAALWEVQGDLKEGDQVLAP